MHCFLDLDGVLVDMHKVLYPKLGLTDPLEMQTWNNGKAPIPQESIWNGTDADWWADLPWTEDGPEILHNVQKFFGDNITICTSLAPWPGCAEGKLRWLQKNIPQYARRFVLTVKKAPLASPRHYLVDDSDHNTETFREAGGRALLIPRIWNNNRDRADDAVDYLQEMLPWM